MGHPAFVGGKGAPQVPRLPPDFLSGLVVSVDFMRLSSKKAAHVVVEESSVVGNPEFARDDKGEGGRRPLVPVNLDGEIQPTRDASWERDDRLALPATKVGCPI